MGCYRFALGGDIDLIDALDLRAALRTFVGACDKHLVVDCLRLRSVDSGCLSVLLEAHGQLEAAGRYLRVTNVPSRLRHTFECCGLGPLIYHDDQIDDVVGAGRR
jgi:anti-anti-sigma factor